MNSTEKLIHGFRRSVIGAEKTFPIVELNPTSRKIFTEQIRAAKFKGDIVVGYFCDADEWAVILSDGLIWSNGGQAGVLSIEAVAGARVDLKINKALANAKSLAECRLVTIALKDGAEFSVGFENGSTAIAAATVVGELLKIKAH
jgi:hypothetical protein